MLTLQNGNNNNNKAKKKIDDRAGSIVFVFVLFVNNFQEKFQ